MNITFGKPTIIRIRHHALRIALCVLMEPLWALQMIVVWSMPERWGGHPNGWRIFAPDAWAFHLDCWWAACMGHFVEVPRNPQ